MQLAKVLTYQDLPTKAGLRSLLLLLLLYGILLNHLRSEKSPGPNQRSFKTLCCLLSSLFHSGSFHTFQFLGCGSPTAVSGLPMYRLFPCGFQYSACLVTILLFRSVCPFCFSSHHITLRATTLFPQRSVRFLPHLAYDIMNRVFIYEAVILFSGLFLSAKHDSRFQQGQL